MAGFDLASFTRELAILERGGFRQIRRVSIDVSSTMTDIEQPYEGNALWLMPEALINGAVDVSTPNVRAWIKINEKNSEPIPVSLSPNSGDVTIISATIRRFFVTTIQAAAAKLHFAVMLGVSIGSSGGVGGPGGGGYLPPSGGPFQP